MAVKRRTMMLASIVLVVAGVMVVANAATGRKTRAEWEAFFAKEDRAYALRPSRRDSPLRYQNISDNEVREIQSVALTVVPRAIVNISGVVVGCPCEDGPGCAEQVWILASRPGKTVGLLLSKIEKAWVIGPVQEWWLNYEDLQSRASSLEYSEFSDARDQMIEAFPACTAQ
jgi:hypothetical protein